MKLQNYLEQRKRQSVLLPDPEFRGKYLSLHFREFLLDPIETQEQENAYYEICDYLD